MDKFSVKEIEEDEVLERLRKSGKVIKELGNITQDDITKAIKEIRKEW